MSERTPAWLAIAYASAFPVPTDGLVRPVWVDNLPAEPEREKMGEDPRAYIRLVRCVVEQGTELRPVTARLLAENPRWLEDMAWQIGSLAAVVSQMRVSEYGPLGVRNRNALTSYSAYVASQRDYFAKRLRPGTPQIADSAYSDERDPRLLVLDSKLSTLGQAEKARWRSGLPLSDDDRVMELGAMTWWVCDADPGRVETDSFAPKIAAAGFALDAQGGDVQGVTLRQSWEGLRLRVAALASEAGYGDQRNLKAIELKLLGGFTRTVAGASEGLSRQVRSWMLGAEVARRGAEAALARTDDDVELAKAEVAVAIARLKSATEVRPNPPRGTVDSRELGAQTPPQGVDGLGHGQLRRLGKGLPGEGKKPVTVPAAGERIVGFARRFR